jgi:histone H1/5
MSPIKRVVAKKPAAKKPAAKTEKPVKMSRKVIKAAYEAETPGKKKPSTPTFKEFKKTMKKLPKSPRREIAVEADSKGFTLVNPKSSKPKK